MNAPKTLPSVPHVICYDDAITSVTSLDPTSHDGERLLLNAYTRDYRTILCLSISPDVAVRLYDQLGQALDVAGRAA